MIFNDIMSCFNDGQINCLDTDIIVLFFVNFVILGRQNKEVKFNPDGDAYGSYTIYQYQKQRNDSHAKSVYDYVKIGEYAKER